MTKRYLVTGGGGFVGAALCRALIHDGHSVTALARGSYPALQQIGVNFIRCDIASDQAALATAVDGIDGVFHVASKVDSWGSRSDFYSTNVIGTRNLLSACKTAGVRNFVYTSTPSVVECGRDLINGDESLPYPAEFDAYYPKARRWPSKRF